MQINDGGPAFPSPFQQREDGLVISNGAEGMSLRAWLTGKALAGILADPNTGTCSEKQIAAAAVRMADAVIAELNRTGEG